MDTPPWMPVEPDVAREAAGSPPRGKLRVGYGRLVPRVARALVDFLLPPVCMACRGAVDRPGCLCAPCWRQVEFVTPPVTGDPAMKAALSGSHTNRLRAAALFGEVTRNLVHTLKYADRLDIAPAMAAMMARAGADVLADADALIPVPLHGLRRWRRRFNQSALLARHIARASGVPVRNGWLVRARMTVPQVGLDREARLRNVAGAFHVPETVYADIRGHRVVLVDDVYTTGATLHACTEALMRAGAGRVDVLVFARVADMAA